jgi:translation initiation factor IF-2
MLSPACHQVKQDARRPARPRRRPVDDRPRATTGRDHAHRRPRRSRWSRPVRSVRALGRTAPPPPDTAPGRFRPEPPATGPRPEPRPPPRFRPGPGPGIRARVRWNRCSEARLRRRAGGGLRPATGGSGGRSGHAQPRSRSRQAVDRGRRPAPMAHAGAATFAATPPTRAATERPAPCSWARARPPPPPPHPPGARPNGRLPAHGRGRVASADPPRAADGPLPILGNGGRPRPTACADRHGLGTTSAGHRRRPYLVGAQAVAARPGGQSAPGHGEAPVAGGLPSVTGASRACAPVGARRPPPGAPPTLS